MIGTTLSHDRITEKLGAGGMGEVYRAEDTNRDRQVAIKVLPDIFSGDPKQLAQWTCQANAAAKGRHEVRRKLCTTDPTTEGESHHGTTSRQPNGGFIGAGSGCPSHTTPSFGALEGALKHLALPANLHLVFPA
jgi:serine/threonine protein kinase